MFKFSAFVALIASIASPALARDSGSWKQLDNTKATLVSEHTAIKAGEDIHLAVILEPNKGWHTYWENPGDAGLAPTLSWTLPEGFKAGNIDWPAPEHLKEGTLLTYSYKSTSFLAVNVSTPSTLDSSKDQTIKVKAEWLVCNDICIPESAELELTLPVITDNLTASSDSEAFAEHRKTRPADLKDNGSFFLRDKQLVFSIPTKALGENDIEKARFSLRQQNVMDYSAKQDVVIGKDTIQITAVAGDEVPKESLSGIFSITNKDGSERHYNILFNATEPSTLSNAPSPAATEENLWFPVVLLLALLGGIVLNLMPCVLPILSLKALAIAKKGGGKHEHVVAQGVAYTAGILVTFTAIAGLLLILRSSGESVGWGYQMQSPAFVGFLIYLLFMVGLNLSGVFHLPVLLGNVGGDLANESSTRGSFFTGVLATAVATPCTAPFMASAVGAALTMPPFQALLVFEALGFGLALPFLLISLFPSLRAFLPKPGAWMDTFKQLIAFPMYASVIWLMWVLTLQTGAGGMVIALCGMLLIVVVIWMKSLFVDGSKTYSIVALVMYALLLLVTLPDLSSMEGGSTAVPNGHVEHGVNTVEYSKEALDALLKEGKPVFVDVTAAWCITCQVNARSALHTAATMKAFKDNGVTLMIADWTKRNDKITDFLSSFGYKGVPLNVFYPAGGKKPVVMPQILTESLVITTIKGD